MQVEVKVSSSESTKHEFACVSIRCQEMGLKSLVDFDFTSLEEYSKEISTVALDFIFVATIVYCVDKMILRSFFNDKWTRELQVNIPVTNIKLWENVKNKVERCFSFLTGDKWEIHFTKLKCNLYRPSQKNKRKKLKKVNFKPNRVCLFSGGLDSLIGAINCLEENPKENLLLVGHHDGAVAGPLSDQEALFSILQDYYKDRVNILKVRVGQCPAGKETTYRSRSLIFAALGIYAAQAISQKVPLLMPENGTIAINVPLTVSRRGSCSTRTAHPFYLSMLHEILKTIGIKNTIINPLEYKTKGEGVIECLNQQILKKTAVESVSCAKRGHNRIWKNRSAKSCGFCMPCIYRRAALHSIGIDNQLYGLDVCKGDVNIRSSDNAGNDLRAFLSFLNKNHLKDKINSELLNAGGIRSEDICKYSDLVFRALEEIRIFLNDKGNESLRQNINNTSEESRQEKKG